MFADKLYFKVKVKGDLSRFFRDEEVLTTLHLKTQRGWDHNSAGRKSFVIKGFETDRFFQRYPNILEI